MLKTMHFFNKKLILFAALCGIVSPIGAHVHRIEHWSNGDQSLYLVHDYHISSHPNNKICDQQQLDLLGSAKQYKAFVITEDMSVYNNKAFFTDPYNYDPNVPAVHKHRKKHPITRPPIVGLTVRCQDQKIPVHNVEFRQAGVASRNGEKRISAKITLAISNKARDDIKNYNDGPILNNYYQEEVALYDRNISNAHTIFEPIKKAIEPLKKILPLLGWCEAADDIIVGGTHFDASGAKIWSKSSRLDMATNLYDMRLLDARIMHTIHQNKNKLCMFICVGSQHLRHIKPVLEKIGYEQTGIIGESYITQDGTACEPDAIDVTQAFEALPQPKVQPKTAGQDNSNNLWMVLFAIAVLGLLMFFGKKKPTNNIKTAAGILLFFASILSQSSLHGYIYCVDVLESPKYKTKIVLLSDVHIARQGSIQHRNDIASWVRQAKVQTAIEDGQQYALELAKILAIIFCTT